jgi:prophage regulatory protein
MLAVSVTNKHAMKLNESAESVQPQYGSPQPHDNRVTNAPAKPGRLLRLPAVMERCALGRSSIYAGVRNGTFVTPVRLSARAVGWREEEIDRWVSERVKTPRQA